MTVLIDGRDLSTFSAADKDALIVDLLRENAALAGLQRGMSHGFVRLRAFVDPSVARKPLPPEAM